MTIEDVDTAFYSQFYLFTTANWYNNKYYILIFYLDSIISRNLKHIKTIKFKRLDFYAPTGKVWKRKKKKIHDTINYWTTIVNTPKYVRTIKIKYQTFETAKLNEFAKLIVAQKPRQTNQKLSSRRGNNFEIRSTCQPIPLIRNGNSVVEWETERKRRETRRNPSWNQPKRSEAVLHGSFSPVRGISSSCASTVWLVRSSRIQQAGRTKVCRFPRWNEHYLSLSLSLSLLLRPRHRISVSRHREDSPRCFKGNIILTCPFRSPSDLAWWKWSTRNGDVERALSRSRGSGRG